MSPSQSSTSLSSYDETETLGLINDIYEVLIRQGAFTEKDIIRAPPQGHAINLSLLDNPDRIDARVVSLMRKLSEGPEACIAPSMKPVYYLSSDDLVWSRDIDRREMGMDEEAPHDQTNALPTVLLLLSGRESTDPALVLDVAHNTIRYFTEMYNGPHYMDFPAEHAPTYLRRMRDNFRQAKWVANHDGAVLRSDHQYPWTLELQRTLLEDYKWPGDEFRREDWIRDAPPMIDSLMQEEYQVWAGDCTAASAMPVLRDHGLPTTA
ncbi:hypothetical protein LTR56_011183 [Elasticomyces elasticus]|nr:hypothetical protein LTR56_011183 [Elasticomyces elasticus]KAK4921815.1 hypothetical protein LTR49_010753 [Elasticomyces elasticus]KAK5753423.1 hypothetical protein LTS12_016474 [Elasticomyces elasticus]